MSFIFDGTTRSITEQALPGNPLIATYDVLIDLWSAGEIWWYSSDNQKYEFPFRQSGGGLRFIDGLGNAVYATADIYLQNQLGQNWRIVFADYPHTVRFSGANLYSEDADRLTYDLSTLTNPVIVELNYSDIQTSYLVQSGSGSGGATPAQIWQHSTRSLTDKSNFTLTPDERLAIAAIVRSELAADFANVSVDQQQIRDAMKLAASVGEAEEGSIDEMLKRAEEQATIAARKLQN